MKQMLKNTNGPRRGSHWLRRLVLAVQRRWDWWIYRCATSSLRRMTLDNPGMSYLMELNLRSWNEQLEISPELKRATEAFHSAMEDHRHNASVEAR